MDCNIDTIINILEQEVARYSTPIVDLIAVQTRDPYRVLVATILSARTKDETTAKAAARLFKKAPDIQRLSLLREEEIAHLIYPVGFYRNKAAYLTKLPEALKPFDNTIPEDIETLVRLPGVGRKTANLVVSRAFNKQAICVDTHVHRIMNIWGYVRTKTPLATEMALREKLPVHYWQKINSILVAFGQGTCKPVRPHCDQCVIAHLCPKIGVTPRSAKQGGRAMKTNSAKRFLSWNVNGLRAAEKKGFVEIIKELSPDILALQEIKARPEQLSDALKNIPGYTSHWRPAERKGYAGVCVYAKKEPLNVIHGLGISEYDSEGRVLTLEYDDFFFTNVYFPNAQPGLARLEYKLAFNRDLLAFVEGLSSKKSVVIGGDFNVAHKAIDLKNPESNENNPGYSPPERAWMDRFLDAGYVDTFRKFTPEPGHYTWWTYRFNARARNIGWRIDYFCVDRKSEQRVQGASILKDIMGSDHCPVQLDFE